MGIAVFNPAKVPISDHLTLSFLIVFG